MKLPQIEKVILGWFREDEIAKQYTTEEDVVRRFRKYAIAEGPVEQWDEDDMTDAYNIAIGRWCTEDSTPDEFAMSVKLGEAKGNAAFAAFAETGGVNELLQLLETGEVSPRLQQMLDGKQNPASRR